MDYKLVNAMLIKQNNLSMCDKLALFIIHVTGFAIATMPFNKNKKHGWFNYIFLFNIPFIWYI